MAGLFLFYSSLTDEGAGCVLISDDSSIRPEFRFFSFLELRQLQEHQPLVIVLSSAHAVFHSLEMAFLPEKKARMAIPFALEDELSKPLDRYHFAFSRAFYQGGKYLIISLDSNFLAQGIEQLKKENIECQNITLDWFALKEHEAALTGNQLLINQADFKGSLSMELAELFAAEQPFEQLYCFSDSENSPLQCSEKLDIPSAVWVAGRLAEQPWINISQGPLKQGNKTLQLKKWLLISSSLALLWAVTWLGASLYQIHQLSKDIDSTDAKIAKIYRQYFPGAKKIINPKFRLSQLFKSDKPGERQQLWFMMGQLSQSLQDYQIHLQRIVYQNRQLTLTLISPDFNQLEEFEQRLESQGIKVKQTQAGNSKQGVVATLELS